MADKTPRIEQAEAVAAEVKGRLDNALSRLHSAVDSVIDLAEDAGTCPYTTHKCPLWDELSRFRADKRNGN